MSYVQDGFWKDVYGFLTGKAWVIIITLGTILLFGLIALLSGIKWETSEDIVSGIVYDNTNNALISGNTHFKIRASADMYADENTSRTYCLPPGSEYIDLVKEAASDKNIRVVVSTEKDFKFMLPWECNDNVKVERVE